MACGSAAGTVTRSRAQDQNASDGLANRRVRPSEIRVEVADSNAT